ncbi:DUF5788 family protein [Haloarchaeobius sp. DFWS5]|uniref:DUF5788 family protein n=1 Tax=Haloarchaeobius sp. DFWS5 TaxID=3446114 RepID=UPI003EBBDFD0
MEEHRRDELLDQLRRSSARVGGSMPESVVLNDETVPLQQFYFEVSGRDQLSPTESERVEEVLRFLRRERLRLVQLVENDEVDYETGTELVTTVANLERAINAFESLEGSSIGEELRQKKIQSARELVDMMRSFGV